MSELKPLSGNKFIRAMRPVLGLPENITEIRIEAKSDGVVYIDLSMLPNDMDFGSAVALCDNCKNRGQIVPLTEETYCKSCIHGEQWKQDYYEPKENRNE